MITCVINGKTMTMREIAAMKRVAVSTVHNALRRFENRYPDATVQEIDKMVEGYVKGVGSNAKLYNGKTAKAWAEIIGINEMTFRWRVREYGIDSPRVYETKEQALARRGKKHSAKLKAWHKANPGVLRKKQKPKPRVVVLPVKEDRSPGWYERAYL